MHRTIRFFVAIAIVCGGTVAIAADGSSVSGPRIGEVRTFAIGPGNLEAATALRRDGWLPAQGQTLQIKDFPELYAVIGRDWTVADVPEGQFVVPELHDRSQPVFSSENPSGVLGPGDLVTSGHTVKRTARKLPLAYWIYVGRDASRTDPGNVAGRKVS
jgi:hypothetical protein